MIGLARDNPGTHATAPAAATVTTSTGATALEVAALRERIDGVSMKLGDVERRVGVLEAAPVDRAAHNYGDPSGAPTPVTEQSDAQGVEPTEERNDADASGPSLKRSDHSAGTSPASIDGRAGARPREPRPESTPVVLMLTDGQFQQWLESRALSPMAQAEHEPAAEELNGDWRIGQNAARATRRGRR